MYLMYTTKTNVFPKQIYLILYKSYEETISIENNDLIFHYGDELDYINIQDYRFEDNNRSNNDNGSKTLTIITLLLILGCFIFMSFWLFKVICCFKKNSINKKLKQISENNHNKSSNQQSIKLQDDTRFRYKRDIKIKTKQIRI